jgi:hypothetical protein
VIGVAGGAAIGITGRVVVGIAGGISGVAGSRARDAYIAGKGL